MRKKNGFTLIELIIVIAILGILMGVLIPSWGYYLERARVRTQNNKAKAIFNAAQTIAIDLDFAERRYVEAYNKLGATSEQKASALSHLYSHVPGVDVNNEWYYYWDGDNGYRCDEDGNKLDADNSGYGDKSIDMDDLAIDEWDEKIGTYIKKILDEEMVYKLYVKDYKVQSVVSARFADDRYIGAYPTTTDKIDEIGKSGTVETIRSTGTQHAEMKLFDLNTTDIPT